MDNSHSLNLDWEARGMNDLLSYPFSFSLLWAKNSEGGKKNYFFHHISFALHQTNYTEKRVEFLLKVSVITRGFSIQNVTAGSINIWRTVALGTITRSKRSGQDTFNLALMV